MDFPARRTISLSVSRKGRFNRRATPESVRRLKQNGRIYFLDRPLEQLCPTSDRPLSSNADALRKRYEERYPLYNAVCDQRIPAEGTIEENVELVLNAAGFGKRTAR